ncbi:hypothetical protein F3Y22_tig00110429pilonHSYRG01384 [Hibiscus syriacus]|uniref:Uncharacterized protein n=1 Tax=Hibiscus syriacus TaxID=106335 RepID=A0A6A3AQF9_HIBSY|nr:hypothetical protein F3Y22_tig00110429pilonHSYRG01384 [Hibiscus syriacus]
METNKKRGIFSKGKLAKSFYSRATAKSRATAAHQQSSKVVPYSNEQTTLPNLPFSTQRVSFNPPSFYEHNANKTWGPADDNVDVKAASFISNVRKRFELD